MGFLGMSRCPRALHGDVGLLEFCQADQAEQGWLSFFRRTFEGDQHADGEAVVVHHQQSPDDEGMARSYIYIYIYNAICSRPLATTL